MLELAATRQIRNFRRIAEATRRDPAIREDPLRPRTLRALLALDEGPWDATGRYVGPKSDTAIVPRLAGREIGAAKCRIGHDCRWTMLAAYPTLHASDAR
jgi:hypothetical protein